MAKTLACPLENVKLIQQLSRTKNPYTSTIPLVDGWSLLYWIPEHCGFTALWYSLHFVQPLVSQQPEKGEEI